jgi:hypothetical protein
MKLLSGQKDAIDCLIYLIGLGYISRPLLFLEKHLHKLDAVLKRHSVRALVQSFQPPMSIEFALRLFRILTSAGAKEAMMSVHFSRTDVLDARKLFESVQSQKPVGHGLSGQSEAMIRLLEKFAEDLSASYRMHGIF